MTIEQSISDLVNALDRNTAALTGKSPVAAPAATAAPVASTPAKPGPKPKATTAAAPAPTAAPGAVEPAKLQKAREDLKALLDSKGADAVREILKTAANATKLSEVTPETIDNLLATLDATLNPQEAAAGGMFD